MGAAATVVKSLNKFSCVYSRHRENPADGKCASVYFKRQHSVFWCGFHNTKVTYMGERQPGVKANRLQVRRHQTFWLLLQKHSGSNLVLHVVPGF